MSKYSYSKKWVFLVAGLSILIIYAYLGNSIFSLNSWVYSYWGDAIKNYYHVLAAAKNSEGLWLNSINYPFGENLFFLDAQVLLSKFLQYFGLEHYTIGFVNGLAIFSLSLTAIFIFLIQRELKVSLVINIITALFIAMLSPQIARMSGHFALAYTCYIPILIYLILKIQDKPKTAYALLMLIILFFSYLHLYFLLIGIVLVFSLLPYHLYRKNYKLVLANILVVMTPLLLVKLSLLISDPVLDRPDSPFGIESYNATFAGVFYPQLKPFKEILKQFLNIGEASFESASYVGILGFPMLILSIYYVLKSFVKKEKLIGYFEISMFMYLFFAAFFIWFVALYYPLKFIIDPTLELVPLLKQFRSLGRFSWILYYVFSVFISLQLSHLFQFIKNKKFSFGVVFIFLFLWFIDANANMNTLKEKVSKRRLLSFDETSCSSETIQKIRKENFDAIMALPLFHVGSEIDNYEGSGLSLLECFKLSNVCQLSYVSTYSSRVSTSQFVKVKSIIETGSLNDIFLAPKKILIVADINLLSSTDSLVLSKSEIIESNENLVFAQYLYE